MPYELIQVDAFTDTPYAGNPAAICLLDKPAEEAWMQAVAAEMNLAETAFLVPRADPEAEGYDLRWFTPTVEVDLCGHATLASAHALYEQGLLPADAEARFHTRSGLLTVRAAGEGWLQMDFPALATEPTEPPPVLATALGLQPGELQDAATSRFDLLVRVASPEVVHGLQPDMGALSRLDVRGTIVTAQGDGAPYDFVSRFFAPGRGIPEDPVTGSAHCALGPYWAERLGRSELFARQASPRGGDVRVSVQGERVLLSGRAVTVLEGRLR